MNLAIVLGQLCIDERFRKAFFANRGKKAGRLLATLPLPFTAAERKLLLRISKHGGHSPGLNQDFGHVEQGIRAALGCGRGPCPFYNFTLNPPPPK